MRFLKIILIFLTTLCIKYTYSNVFEIKSYVPYYRKIEVDYVLSDNKYIEKYFNEYKFDKISYNSDPKVNDEFSEFLGDFIEGIENETLGFKYINHLKYLGKVSDAYMFENYIEENQGAVHPIIGVSYIILNSKAKKIKLYDIIENDKKFNMLYEKYYKIGFKDITLFSENNVEKTTNFYFAPNGLKFVFQPYEIAPFSYGTPSFTIPYSKLKGVIKPQYILK